MASSEAPSTAAEVDGDSDFIKAAERSVATAEEAYKIAMDDPNISESLLSVLDKSLRDTKAMLAMTMSRRCDASSDVKTVVPEKKGGDHDEAEEDEEEETDKETDEETDEEVQEGVDQDGQDEDEEEEADPLLKAATEADKVLGLVEEVCKILKSSSMDLEEVCQAIVDINATFPSRGAFRALRAINRALQSKPVDAAEGKMKEIQHKVRDIIVLRTKSVCKNPKDRDEFLKVAADDYGGSLDTEDWKAVRAQVLLAYHKDPKNKNGFVSNNQVAAQRRGAPRPRRRRRASQEQQHGSSSAASTDQLPAPPPIVKPKTSEKPESVVKPECNRSRNKIPVRSAMPRPQTQTALKPGLQPSSCSFFDATVCPSSSSSSSWHPYQYTMYSPSCSRYQSPWHEHGNYYGNNSGMGSPWPLREVAVPWDSWQVLILVELNKLLVNCTLDPLSGFLGGEGIDFGPPEGWCLRIRPGAIELLRCALTKSPRSCTLGFFSGLNPSMVLRIVKVLLKQMFVHDGDEWQAEIGPCNSVSVINKNMTLRVHIFQRTEHEEIDPDNFSDNSREQQFNWLHDDLSRAMSLANNQANCCKFSLQNTVLVAFEKERTWFPDNVLSVERWMQWEDGNYMKSVEDRITDWIETQPTHVRSWLRPGVQFHYV